MVKKSSILLIVFGIMLQLAGFLSAGAPDALWLSLISGICGVFSVVLCSEKKMSFYIFGFLQLITYIILCFHQNLYGEIAENAFYFVTMVGGIFIWKRHYNKEKDEVETLRFSPITYPMLICAVILLSALLGTLLSDTNDTQPWLDAFSTVPAFVAQMLMIFRFKEQWYFWLVVDVLTGIMWGIAGDWCMVAQYVFWTINCIYGLKLWSNTTN